MLVNIRSRMRPRHPLTCCCLPSPPMTSKIGQGAGGLCYKARREGGGAVAGERERRATELSLDVFYLDLASLSLRLPPPPPSRPLLLAAPVVGGGGPGSLRQGRRRFTDEGGKGYARFVERIARNVIGDRSEGIIHKFTPS